MMIETTKSKSKSLMVSHLVALTLCLASFGCSPADSSFVARRAADDARPLNRVHVSQEAPIVMGRFRAPAPEQMTRHHLAKSSEIGTETMRASFRVADVDSHLGSPSSAERTVHGVPGASVSNSKLVKVGAKMQVSDEGLNYPPSKLSADIYGNVAEIVTAPPESLENDFLIPESNNFFGTH